MSGTSKKLNALRRASPLLILSTLLGILIVVSTSFVIFQRYVATQGSEKTESPSLIVRSISTEDRYIGDTQAPIQIVVYASLSCPYCKQFFEETYQKLKTKYGDQIVVAYRHLPLASQPKSRVEAHAAECIYTLGGNDSFWKFVRAVFARSGFEKGLDLTELASIADEVGLTGAQMSACVQSGDSDERVHADTLEASIAGISQTPGIVLKSETRALIVRGNYYGQLDTGIEYLLQSNAEF